MKTELSGGTIHVLPRGVHTELASFHGEVGVKAVTMDGELAVRVVMMERLEPQFGERLDELLHEMIEAAEAISADATLHIV